jgi:cytochrome P450
MSTGASNVDPARPARKPVRVVPPQEPLPLHRLLPTLVRNLIEAWPQAVYQRPIFWRRLLNRDTLFVMDPELIRVVLLDEADKFKKSAAMLRSLEPALGRGLLTADGSHWRWQRRAASPIFRHERIVEFLPAMIEAAERRRDAWHGAAGRTVDVASEMMRTTFDIIVETMLSGRSGIDVDRVEHAVTDYLESTSWTVVLALLRAPAWIPYPGRRRAELARDFLRAELLRVVSERRRSADIRHDLIALLLAAEDPETGQAMSDRDLVDNLLTFVTAGHETTALALTWTFYLLDLYPASAECVIDEISSVTGGEPLRPDHVAGLAYTRQVLQEAMRLYPPAPIIVREATEDVTVGDQRVAAGTSIFLPVYAIHRHAALWQEPDAFDPERFTPEAMKRQHRYAYLPFGAGSRICIGMSFALIEAVAILAVLLPAVRLHAEGPDPTLKLRVTLRPGKGMPMRIERR